MKVVLLGGFAAIVFVLGIMGIWFLGTYNGLASESQQVDTQWAQVETQYQRRYDLIPNLVAATQGYLNQEKTIFKDIADARTGYAGAKSQGVDAQVKATSNLDSAVSRLLVVMENYPVLKSDATVKSLTDELAGTENRISVARQRYNENVQTYDLHLKTFPTVIFAGMFGYSAKPLYQSEATASTAPVVKLNQ